MATIKDVAKLAGVSPMTVSRAINNPDLVSIKTVDIVLKAAHELNYTPNLLARGLITNKTHTIGILLTSIENLIYNVILSGITETATKYGYDILIAYATNPQEAMDNINVLMSKQIDGLILAPCDFREKDPTYSNSYITSIQMYDDFLKRFDVFSRDCYAMEFPIVGVLAGNFLGIVGGVQQDYRIGTHMAIEYLYKMNHRKIGCLTHILKDRGIWLERYNSFLEIMEKKGCVINNNWIVDTLDLVDSSFESMRKLLQCKDLPTAVYCMNDDIAVGAINACHSLGVRVPEDISIIGHDGSYIGTIVYPKLTTISLHPFNMGVECVNILLNTLKTGNFDRVTKIIRPTLIERDSVKLINI